MGRCLLSGTSSISARTEPSCDRRLSRLVQDHLLPEAERPDVVGCLHREGFGIVLPLAENMTTHEQTA